MKQILSIILLQSLLLISSALAGSNFWKYSNTKDIPASVFELQGIYSGRVYSDGKRIKSGSESYLLVYAIYENNEHSGRFIVAQTKGGTNELRLMQAEVVESSSRELIMSPNVFKENKAYFHIDSAIRMNLIIQEYDGERTIIVNDSKAGLQYRYEEAEKNLSLQHKLPNLSYYQVGKSKKSEVVSIEEKIGQDNSYFVHYSSDEKAVRRKFSANFEIEGVLGLRSIQENESYLNEKQSNLEFILIGIRDGNKNKVLFVDSRQDSEKFSSVNLWKQP